MTEVNQLYDKYSFFERIIVVTFNCCLNIGFKGDWLEKRKDNTNIITRQFLLQVIPVIIVL